MSAYRWAPQGQRTGNVPCPGCVHDTSGLTPMPLTHTVSYTVLLTDDKCSPDRPNISRDKNPNCYDLLHLDHLIVCPQDIITSQRRKVGELSPRVRKHWGSRRRRRQVGVEWGWGNPLSNRLEVWVASWAPQRPKTMLELLKHVWKPLLLVSEIIY